MSVATTSISKLPISAPFSVATFAPDAMEVREAVIHGQFGAYTGPDGATYTGISTYPVPHWPKLIEQAIGQEINVKLTCFRLNLKGELPHSWVHSDDICAKYASVLYLNTPEQCQGGTAFWEHRDLGLKSLPSREQLEQFGWNPDFFYDRMTLEWKLKEKWQMYLHILMRFNCFITYPTSLFHSRFPFEGFGTSPADGRLIWVAFYDVRGE